MSQRAALWTLWGLLMLAAPLPYYALEPGREPVSHLAVFAAATGAAAIAEPSPIAWIIAGFFLSQTVLYAALFYLLLLILVRRIESAATRRTLVLVTAAVLLLLAMLPVYVTPFSPSGPTGNLLNF